jgi:hypothetical protein
MLPLESMVRSRGPKKRAFVPMASTVPDEPAQPAKVAQLDSTFHRFNLEWKTRTLRAFIQAA